MFLSSSKILPHQVKGGGDKNVLILQMNEFVWRLPLLLLMHVICPTEK